MDDAVNSLNYVNNLLLTKEYFGYTENHSKLEVCDIWHHVDKLHLQKKQTKTVSFIILMLKYAMNFVNCLN